MESSLCDLNDIPSLDGEKMLSSQTNAAHNSTEASSHKHTTPSKPASNASSTPQSNKLTKSQQFTMQKLSLAERRLQLRWETAGRFLGPILWQEFLDDFLPNELSGPVNSFEARSPVNFSSSSATKDETTRCEMFLKTMKQAEVPLLRFMDSGKYQDPEYKLKPDICVYPHDFVIPDDKPTDFPEMEFWIEFKQDPDDDAFLGPGDEEPTIEGLKSRDQMSDYAAASMGLRFRTHLLSVFICGNYARLVRWDIGGAVFTERIDYTKDAAPIMEFFHRYSNATSKKRGFDPTISKPSGDEQETAQTALEEHVRDCTNFLKVKIPGRKTTADSGNVEIGPPGEYIIPALTPTNCSPFGRATRSSVAYNLKTKRVVYYKDYWRSDPDGGKILPEGKIYERLEKYTVSHIAPFECGGDVEDNVTRSHKYAGYRQNDPESQSTEILPYINYRIALGVVGIPLSKFKSPKELLQVVADAMEGHDEAYAKAGVLHRDISVGNIMIVRKEDGTSEGLLIDWDLCCLVGSTDGPRRATRTGTWQFISCHLLQKPGEPHTIIDDRESALHLLTWLVLRHVQHNLPPQTTATCLEVFDEVCFNYEKPETGGSQKQINLTSGHQVPSKLVFDHVPHLKNLINGLAAIFKFRYHTPSEAEYTAFKKLQDFHKDQPEFLVGHYVQDYTLSMDLLGEPGWLVKTLRDHIENHEWPLHDGALSFHANEPIPAIRTLENTK